MYRLLFVFGLAVLSGCQTAKPVAEVVDVRATDPDVKNGDVLSSRRAAGEEVPQLRGTNLLTVRTYHRVKSEKSGKMRKQEMTGAQCNVKSDGFEANVRTPGQVRVPDYGYASRLVTLKCVADGYKNGFANVGAYDVSKANRRTSAAGGGLLAVVAVELINAADDEKNNRFAYPQANVYMNRIGCEDEPGGCRSD